MTLMTLLAAAAAAQLTALALPTEDVDVMNPCTNERVAFSGPIDVEARSSLAGPTPNVQLTARMLAVTAEGRRTGSRYTTRDALDVELQAGPLPWATATAWKAAFLGAGRDRFDAHITLYVSLQPDGSAGVTLGNVVISCP